MTKHGWTLWLAPAAVWAVYMCWLAGYQSGYEQGLDTGWSSARQCFMPRTAQLDASAVYAAEPALIEASHSVTQ